MSKALITVSTGARIGAIDPRVFGSFVEHLGRCVYDGIYEPRHPTADEQGFREDVLALVRELGVTDRALPGRQLRLRVPLGGRRRAPGGPPRAARPRLALDRDQRGRPARVRALELARPAASRCSRSTSGPAASSRRSTWSSTRTCPPARPCPTSASANGAEEGFGVGMWCLGNEMDGPWQLGHRSAVDYGKLASRTAKALRQLQPDLAARGLRQLERSDADLRHLGARGPRAGLRRRRLHLRARLLLADATATSTASSPPPSTWTASSSRWARPSTTSRPEKRSTSDVHISFDEWNVWYQDRYEGEDKIQGHRQLAQSRRGSWRTSTRSPTRWWSAAC